MVHARERRRTCRQREGSITHNVCCPIVQSSEKLKRLDVQLGRFNAKLVFELADGCPFYSGSLA